MKEIIVAIGTDHRGLAQKEYIKKHIKLDTLWITWLDEGAYTHERSDYPVFAQKVAQLVQTGNAQYGVLLCGSGAGMAIAANRFSGVYAALVWDVETARLAKEHDNANVLVLPSDFISDNQAVDAIIAWLSASFKADRYETRIALIDQWGGI
jgi:ribose 5-phosphate isomerase B